MILTLDLANEKCTRYMRLIFSIKGALGICYNVAIAVPPSKGTLIRYSAATAVPPFQRCHLGTAFATV